MIQQRANFDWMLKELDEGVPGVQQIVVLSADGLRIARYGGDPDGADRIAAALGLLDADTLLRQVYESARTLSYAADVTWREVGRVLRSRSVRPRLRAMLPGKPPVDRSPLAEGVVEQDGEVGLARAARPERDPV
ncbi:hypothetical protein ADL27_12465, partial [Streptomyces sp. NRRL F-6602]